MLPFTFTHRESQTVFGSDDSSQGCARTSPLLRNRRFFVELITRSAASYECEEPQDGKPFKQRGGRKQRVLRTLQIQYHRWGKKNGDVGGCNANESNDVQCVEVWQARGEMREELIERSFGADASTMMIVKRRTGVEGPCEHFESTYVLGKQGETSCTERVATTWAAVVTLTDDAKGTLGRMGEQARLPCRGCGLTCNERKLWRCRSTDGGFVNASEVFAGISCNERSRILLRLVKGWQILVEPLEPTTA